MVAFLSVERVRRSRLDAFTFDEFVEFDSDYGHAYRANSDAVRFTRDEVARLGAVTTPVDLLAVVDRACTDVIATLPIMVELAALTPGLRLSILPRTGAGADLAELFRHEGVSKVPTYAVVDGSGEVLGLIVERTVAVGERIAGFVAVLEADGLFPVRESQRAEVMRRVVGHRSTLREIERASIVAAVLQMVGRPDGDGPAGA